MKKENKERLDTVINMHSKIAIGNFSHRIERSDKKDKIETLIAFVNMTAEELENSLLSQYYINKDETYIERAYLLLLLDEDDKIIHYNPDAGKLLMRGNKELLDSPFSGLLSRVSKENWKIFRTTLGTDLRSDQHIRLEFLVKGNLLLTLNCNTVPFLPDSSLAGHTQLAGSHIQMVGGEGQLRSERINAMAVMYAASDQLYRDHGLENKGISLSREDILKIRKVAAHLLSHSREPLDSLVNLAQTFGTNEYKLKHGFKKVHGETIARFVQNKRLDNALLMIEHSDLPIIEISTRCGFISPTHFSRVFKNKYGESPKKYRKTFLTSVSHKITDLKAQNTPLKE